MTNEEAVKYGQMAFEAYCEFQENKTFDGRDIPKWDQLPVKIKEAWSVSSAFILEDYMFSMLKKVNNIVENKDSPFVTKLDNIDYSPLMLIPKKKGKKKND